MTFLLPFTGLQFVKVLADNLVDAHGSPGPLSEGWRLDTFWDSDIDGISLMTLVNCHILYLNVLRYFL